MAKTEGKKIPKIDSTAVSFAVMAEAWSLDIFNKCYRPLRWIKIFFKFLLKYKSFINKLPSKIVPFLP